VPSISVAEVVLLEETYARAARQVEEVIERFVGARVLARSEVATYRQAGITQGWEIPGLCSEPCYSLRLLLPRSFPFKPPRIAVAPVPSVLEWPHLEDHGFLCLMADAASHSIDDVQSVALMLLEDARTLVNSCISGEGFEQFEDEFQSYWVRWEKTKLAFTSLCSPQGPTRWVSAWHGKQVTVVADNDELLRRWLENRNGDESNGKLSLQQVPFVWLPRPPRPEEYPQSAGELLSLIAGDPDARSMVEALIIDEKARFKSVLLGFEGRTGVGFAGLRIREVQSQGLKNGFRKRPPQQVLLMRWKAAPVLGAAVTRYDSAWVHGRDHNLRLLELQKQSVVVLGIGSVGSTVAELLSKAGVPQITLVDPERLASENVGRHALGASAVGKGKAEGMAQSLARRFPHLTFEGYQKDIDAFALEDIERLRSATLIIAATGSWRAESQLAAIAKVADMPPILYCWTEPYAAAGHAAVFFKGQGCLRCITTGVGQPNVEVSTWPDRDTLVPVPACGGMFQPYGAVDLTYTHALVAELALDVFLGRVKQSTYRVWIGPRRLLDSVGGKWHPNWVEQFGDPGDGALVVDVPIDEQPCSLCKALT